MNVWSQAQQVLEIRTIKSWKFAIKETNGNGGLKGIESLGENTDEYDA